MDEAGGRRVEAGVKSVKHVVPAKTGSTNTNRFPALMRREAPFRMKNALFAFWIA